MSTKANIDAALRGYITCALWSSNDESDERGGEPMDENYSRSDIAASSVRRMRSDVSKFVKANKATIEQYLNYYDWEQLGHDLWLTRNGHGAGFWDRDYRGHDGIGEKLTKGAEKLGGCSLYVGDDHKVYVS